MAVLCVIEYDNPLVLLINIANINRTFQSYNNAKRCGYKLPFTFSPFLELGSETGIINLNAFK